MRPHQPVAIILVVLSKPVKQKARCVEIIGDAPRRAAQWVANLNADLDVTVTMQVSRQVSGRGEYRASSAGRDRRSRGPFSPGSRQRPPAKRYFAPFAKFS